MENRINLSKLNTSKQYLHISICDITTTERWKIFASFSIHYFGPNSKIWGVLANEEQLEKAKKSFNRFYARKMNLKNITNQIFSKEDLGNTRIYTELIHKKNESEELKIDTWFENVSLLINKVGVCTIELPVYKFSKPSRQASPPLEAYKYVSCNMMDIKPDINVHGAMFYPYF